MGSRKPLKAVKEHQVIPKWVDDILSEVPGWIREWGGEKDGDIKLHPVLTWLPPGDVQILKTWCEQANIVYAIASSAELRFFNSQEFKILLDAWNELHIRRKYILRMNRSGSKIEPSMFASYMPLKKLLFAENGGYWIMNPNPLGDDEDYGWEPVKPERLTIKQFNQLLVRRKEEF